MYLTCLFICLYLRIDLKLFFKRSFVLLATLKTMVEKDNFEKKEKSVFYFINIQVKLVTKKECKMLL